jgi:hypothetical protein
MCDVCYEDYHPELKQYNKSRKHKALEWLPTATQSHNGYGLLGNTDFESDYVVISSDVPLHKRHDLFRSFTDNKVPLLLCTAGSGSTGVNLHDESNDGEHPRTMFMTTTLKGRIAYQTMSRVDRPGMMSNAMVNLVAFDCEVASLESALTKDAMIDIARFSSNPLAAEFMGL